MESAAAVNRNPRAQIEEGLEDAQNDYEDEPGEDEEEEEEEEFDEEELSGHEGGRSSDRERMNDLLRRLATGSVRVRVHDVLIKGNTKTKDSLIEAEVLPVFRSASTMQELLQAATAANARLQRLEIFDSVSIVLDAGPSELPGTVNVIIDLVEPKNPLSGDIGFYTRPETRGWSIEGLLKLRNVFGYGDIWNAAGAYSLDHTTEMSAGLSLPRFKALSTPITARVTLLTQDWLKFSSYKERLLGLSFGLVSTIRHELAYNLTWRHLTDPLRMSSVSVRRQLGHSLLSSLKYSYKLDRRNSSIRPMKGYAFLSTSQIGGLGHDSNLLRFIRQEFDLRAAIPLGFFHTALNIGVAAGVIMPWGNGFMTLPTPLTERFHIGGNSSPLCLLGSPTSLLGFNMRGLGPTDLRRMIPSRTDQTSDPPASPGWDALGGDLAVTAFADISFNLPLKVLRDSGIYGHAFISAGNLAKLSEGSIKDFSIRQFAKNFRSSAGIGVIVPTKLFRMEVNYCYILRQFEHDRAKTGIQFSISALT
ncbi:sorting and assembly machinery component 50 homolog [Dendrobium catenatum]|uniref:POTRA domain-containing protein n=1 Tax=Dendrobium catenatum TaxID=906689 RepID=A0A2I0VYX6_9ASPA|nr:sorting and assembly machinery component 50 homolog [Dendrobium catenatum]PKU68614.1 hypothetical protein MA16_Dca023702 [Dendrobium catenatum]